MNQDIGILFRWLDRGGYTKCIHPLTITEIEKYKDEKVVSTFLTKIDSYEKILFASPMQEEVAIVSNKVDKGENDTTDSTLLNEVFIGRVDIFISEDKKIHKKAQMLGIGDKVFTIDSFLEKSYSENPSLVNYKVLNVSKKYFAEINLNDPFFDTLRKDYTGFDKWFIKKSDEIAYVTQNTKNNFLLSFLYLKVEGKNEVYKDISPAFSPKKRLKVGTFKVISNGVRLGERFMKIIFDNALTFQVEEIYVTIFSHRHEQRRLIELLEQWGFVFWGFKGHERIYFRLFTPTFDLKNLKGNYPYISRKQPAYIVPIYESYHTSLLPDSILNNESPMDFIEDFPHRNGINKVYVSRAIKPHPKSGDLLIFYRTGGVYKSVVTTIGIVEDVIYNIQDEFEFLSLCRKGSVYPESELKDMWNQKEKPKPFVIKFLYVYSFPHRINMKTLIDLKILVDVNDAPRGFKPISTAQFNLILKETKSDESFIVD